MADKIASTQNQLDILDITNNLVLTKGGGAALVIQTNAVNFDLLSEREQDAMIGAYATLLNSLSFPIQIVIRSRKLDISAYLAKVDQIAANQPNPYLREKLSSYKEFINGLIQKGEVLDKRFYLVIPFYEFAVSAPSLLDTLRQFLGIKVKSQPIDKARLLHRAKTDLEPKKEHLIKQLNRLGIKSRQLTTPELIELFYGIYNPEQARTQHLGKGISHYTTALVEPAVHEEFASGTPQGGAQEGGKTSEKG